MLIVLCGMLIIDGIVRAEVVSETGASEPGSTAQVPTSVSEGGPIINATGEETVTYEVPAKTIVLTFDDGPDPTWTEQILEVLDKYDVDATFFAVGANIAAYPDIVQEIVDSGSEVGLHTYTHVDLSSASETRMDLELSQSQLALVGATGVTTNLVRPPYSSSNFAIDDDDYAVIERLGAQGYLTVLSDIDSRDWETDLPVAQMLANATPTDGEGATILFHDSGGNRAKTVEVLEQLIPQLLAEGYTFTTVSDAAGLTDSHATASEPDQARGEVELLAVKASTLFARLTSWLLLGIGVLVLLRLLLTVALAVRHRRRRRAAAFSWGPAITAPVSVVVPAYNERECIADTVRSLLASTHPVEVIVVDDGSTDETPDIVAAIHDPRVRLIRQANAGKATALNTGIAHARHDVVVMMDGDTVFEPDTIAQLVAPLADPTVGAVAGNAKIANRRGIVASWQHIEYVVGFAIDRHVQDALGCVTTIPGAVGAFRKTALLAAGGVGADTLAEDTDLTITIGRLGWRVVYQPTARAWTEAPRTLRQLWLQRYRWCYGTMQSMWKHRRAVIERGPSGRIGRRGLLHLALFQVALPLLAPLVDIFLVYGLIFLNPLTTAALWLGVLVLQMTATAIALRMDGESLRALWLVPSQQLIYRQLMYAVLIGSGLTAVAGSRLRWHKLHRVGGLDTALATGGEGSEKTADQLRTADCQALPRESFIGAGTVESKTEKISVRRQRRTS